MFSFKNKFKRQSNNSKVGYKMRRSNFLVRYNSTSAKSAIKTKATKSLVVMVLVTIICVFAVKNLDTIEQTLKPYLGEQKTAQVINYAKKLNSMFKALDVPSSVSESMFFIATDERPTIVAAGAQLNNSIENQTELLSIFSEITTGILEQIINTVEDKELKDLAVELRNNLNSLSNEVDDIKLYLKATIDKVSHIQQINYSEGQRKLILELQTVLQDLDKKIEQDIAKSEQALKTIKGLNK